ncbi:MAG: class I SAM-dependent methyltransferase [Deltaproteobacteria bacterium]|nr:class I SAM-dependent methyltransferase [Deltaproteobacteria bacterium]
MRLAAQAKMGYYPTPERVTEIIIRYLKRERQGLIRILDPCAGEGTALHTIGNHLGAETYGIEIDVERGKRAKEVLTKCLLTDYQNTKISHKSFSLLWLNPPYDWSSPTGEMEKSERFERIFLRDCIPYLSSGGVLVYLIPQRRLDGHIARMLSYRFEDLTIFRFPEEEYKAFKQLVILGVLKKSPGKDDESAIYIKNCGLQKAIVSYLPEKTQAIYEVPTSPSNNRFLFMSKTIDPEELSEEIRAHGLFERFSEITTPLKMTEKIQPIMRLRYGHLAQIIACGFMNGVVWDRDNKNPLLVKGATRKEIKRSVEIEGDIERHIETDKIRPFIQAFDRNGDIFVIQ